MTERKHFVVIVYDISNDRRRTRLHKVLSNFGTPVQFSVFECLLHKDEFSRMIQQMKKVINSRKDHIRIYHLCTRCQRKTHVIAGPDTVEEQNSIII